MASLRSDIVFSMPCAMIQHLPLQEQIKAVKQAGFHELTLHPFMIGHYISAGLSLKDMKSMLDDSGIRVSRLDPLTTWAPDWRAYNFSDDYTITVSMDPLELFELSKIFGTKHISLNGMWKPGRYDINELTEFYARICEKALPYDLTCDIEPIPMWGGCPRLEDALEVINKSGAENVGLVFDVTHFTRGGTPMEVLEHIPGDLIHSVQICDGLMPKPDHLSLEEECFNRMWPGEGGFNIGPIISLLDRIGGLRAVGPEVFANYAGMHTPGDWIVDKTISSFTQYPELCSA